MDQVEKKDEALIRKTQGEEERRGHYEYIRYPL
jgi:hypothetical protein